MPLFGKHILDLSPTPAHMRHSEGSFVRMQDGRIAFVWSRYREGRHDGDTSDLAVIFSADEGESWSAPRTLALCEEWGAVNLMSTSMLTLREDRIALLYLKLTPGLQVRPFLRTTKDLLSFSDERDACAGRSGYFCVANGRLRRLSTGRLIYSGGHNEITEKELAQGDHENADNIVMHSISGVRVYLSDDEGNSFYEAAAPVEMPLDVCSEVRAQGLTESGIEELEDGTLMLQRKISADGKSQTRLNGQAITQAVQREIAQMLVSIHGQSDSQKLLQKSTHAEILDAYARADDSLAAYREVYRALRAAERQIAEIDFKLAALESEKEAASN
jgi:hypothetical protein